MEVGVRQLRDELRRWLDAVEAGDEVVITERGRPIARLIGASAQRPLKRLIAAGVVTPRRRPKEADRKHRRVKARGPIAELLADQRR